MAVNPKLIVAAAKTLSNDRVRRILLLSVFLVLGLVMLAAVAFSGLISGILGIFLSPDVKIYWARVRSSMNNVMVSSETIVNDDVKSEVYDFMPDFSVNISKAVFGGNSNIGLITYEEREVEIAEEEMIKYAEQLRAIGSKDELSKYLSSYDGANLSFSDISDSVFQNDTNIAMMPQYTANVKEFLYARAMEKMPRYEYLYDTGSDYTKQTLNVIAADGKTQTVEYIRYGGGEIYLPRFLAMYTVYQMYETILAAENEEQADSFNEQVAQAVGGIPESADEDETDSYFADILSSTIDGKSSIKLDVFEKANIKYLFEQAILSGDMGISVEQTDNKLTITLKEPSEKIWSEIFDLDEVLDEYVNETKTAIETVLTQANIPITQWTLTLYNADETELFFYFGGLFSLPVSSELVTDSNGGVLTEYGEMSAYQHIASEMGISLALTDGNAPIRINLPDVPKCVYNAFIYDVKDDEDDEDDEEATDGKAVTIAFVIDTQRFAKEYGFPAPSINGVKPGETVTLFMEFTHLYSLNVVGESDIGLSIYYKLNSDFVIGYSCSGDEPHLEIKMSYSSETIDGASLAISPCKTLESAMETSVSVNPRLWIKDFNSNNNTLTNTLDEFLNQFIKRGLTNIVANYSGLDEKTNIEMMHEDLMECLRDGGLSKQKWHRFDKSFDSFAEAREAAAEAEKEQAKPCYGSSELHIAVVGAQSRIGTTSLALRLAKYFQNRGGESVVVCAHQKGIPQLDMMKDMFDAEETGSEIFSANGIDICSANADPQKTYNAEIYDFGSTLTSELDFSGFDKIYLVGGTSWNELPMIYSAQLPLNSVNYTVALNFSDNAAIEKYRELLSVNLNDVILIPSEPDPFVIDKFEDLFDAEFGQWSDEQNQHEESIEK